MPISTRPPKSQTRSLSAGYDANGPKTWNYTYDDENQLIAVATDTYYTPAASRWKTEFTYDGRGRLRVKKDYTWPSSGWVLQTETRYLYDGMRVVQERNGSNTPTVAYTRGKDLSASLEGAGGIGGLLARSHGYSAGTWSTHSFYHADGGGNVTYLVNSSQAMVASNRYDPYGRLLASSGTLAAANVYRFSSKEVHPASGLYYYGYRFYDPNTQRWVNRDPMGEAGGLNLYHSLANNPNMFVDSDGFQVITLPPILLESPPLTAPPRLLLPAPKPRLQLPAPRPPGSRPVPPGMAFPRPPRLPTECWRNPAKSPGSEFQWRGPDLPGGPKGGWYNPKTGETLKPDLSHPKPVGPHWDYVDPNGNHWRLYEDGIIGFVV